MKRHLYSLAELGIFAVEMLLRLHFLNFAITRLGFSPSLAGALLFISLLWDALIDPLVGSWSDHWHRQGRSRWIWVLAGSALASLALLFLFHSSSELGTTPERSVFGILFWLVLLNTGFAFFSIPYSALVGDYDLTQAERAGLIGTRAIFGNLGALCGVAIPAYFLVHDFSRAYSLSALSLALIVLGSTLLASFSHSQFHLRKKKDLPTPSILEFLKNSQIRLLFLVFLVVNVGLAINSASALFFYRLRLRLEEWQTQSILVSFLLFFSFSIPFWLWWSRQQSSRIVLFWGALGLFLLVSIGFPLLPAQNFLLSLSLASLIGGFFVGSSVLIETSLTEILEKSPEPAYGLAFGLWRFGTKISRALGSLIAGPLLAWASVEAPQLHTSERLGLLFGPGVGIFFLLAAFLLWKSGLQKESTLR